MTTESAELARADVEARILVLDDEPEVAAMIADSLREADPSWDVVTETDPQRALESLADAPFDCVVTDLVMPQMDGLDLARRIRSGESDVAMIAISGHGTLARSIEALRIGFADFLEKPFKLEDVQRAVCRTLRRRHRQIAMQERFAELAENNALLEAAQAQLNQKLEVAGHDLVLSNKRMARQLEDLATTASAARTLMGIIELEDLLGLGAELLADRVPCHTASIALYEAQDAAVGLLVRAYPESDDPPVLCWLRTPVQSGVMCRAAQTRKCVHIDQLGSSVLLDPQEKELWREGRLLVAPITYQNTAVGVAALHRGPEGPDFQADDVKRVAALADVFAPAILTAKVHHHQRCQAYAALEAVAEGVERRLPYLAGHGARVLAYAQPLGEALHLDHARIGALQIAARLHDIGHLVVPESAVNHPGPLTEEQWDLVRQHAAAGEAIVAPMDFFGEVGAIIRAHHESYDGTGYPDRKAGEEIPMVARVIAVADAMDAMTSPRPYRAAMDVGEALDQVRRVAGQQFDPRVAQALVEVPETALRAIQATHR